MLAELINDYRHKYKEEVFNLGVQAGKKEGEARGMEIGEARGIEIGEARGIEIGEARGMEIGKARGIEIGEARGIEIGEARGEKAGERKSLHKMINMALSTKFDDMPQDWSETITAITDIDSLYDIFKALTKAQSQEEFAAYLESMKK